MNLNLIVFDLDDTLLDTTQHLIPIRNSPLFEQRLSQPLPLLPGALESLKYFQNKGRMFLLTQGRKDYQQLKIETLGISKYFEQIFICEPDKGESKALIFKKLYRLLKTDTISISIGNRPETDLFPAQDIGFKTVWFKYGEGSDTKLDVQKPDFTVTNHKQLRELFK